MFQINSILIIAQSAVAEEYADCISVEEQNRNNECPGYDTKLHLMVRFHFWRYGNVVYPFIAITYWFTLTQSGSTF